MLKPIPNFDGYYVSEHGEVFAGALLGADYNYFLTKEEAEARLKELRREV